MFDYAGPKSGAVFFLGGKYSDTNREWLNEINQPLHFVLVQVLLGSIVQTWIGGLLHKLAVTLRAKSCYLQYELEELHSGLEFQIHLKLAQHLAYISCILVFSPAIPDLLGLLPIYFLAHYWGDKWLILRVCRLPPRFHISLNDRANYIFGFAILAHTLADLWIFSTPEIFPQEVLVLEASSSVAHYYITPLDALDRALNPALRLYLLLLAATVSVFFLGEPIALAVTKACCFRKPRRGQRTRSGTLRTYSIESLQKSKSQDSFSYDMMKSTRYRRALLLLNLQDIDDADDFAEREQPNLDLQGSDPEAPGQGVAQPGDQDGR